MPSVEQILIAETPTSPMSSRTSVRAMPGRGLEGDRYFIGVGTFSPNPQKHDFEITLIEKEKIEEFARDSGLPFTASHARRNIVTEGVDLNALVGREFYVGFRSGILDRSTNPRQENLIIAGLSKHW